MTLRQFWSRQVSTLGWETFVVALLVGLYPLIYLMNRTPSEIGILLIIVFSAFALVRTRRLGALKAWLQPSFLSLIAWVMLGLWLCLLAATWLSPYDKKAYDLAFAWGRWLLLLVFLVPVLAPYMRSAGVWKTIAGFLAFAAILISFDLLVQKVFGLDLFLQSPRAPARMTGPFVEPLAGMYLTHIAPFGLLGVYYGLSEKPYRWAACLGYLALVALGIFLSGERIFFFYSMIGTVLAIIVMFRLRALIPLAIGALALIAALFAFPDSAHRYGTKTASEMESIIEDFRSGDIEADSRGSYANHIIRGVQALEDRPLLGHGIKGYRYYCTQMLNMPKDVASNKIGCTTHPHHSYLAWGVSAGFIALGLWCLWVVMVYGWMAKLALTSPRDQQLKLVAVAWTLLPFASPLFISENILVNSSELLFWFMMPLLILLMTSMSQDNQQRRDALS